MSTYEPGTVAVATVRGVPNVRVTLDPNDEWFAHVEVSGRRWQDPEDVTDIRPLVVLDLADFARAAKVLRDPMIEALGTRTRIAEQIEEQTKPPRIPEPGLFGVVEASSGIDTPRTKFMRSSETVWRRVSTGAAYRWADLVDPTLVRPGIEDES
jgi:hypothetical protein